MIKGRGSDGEGEGRELRIVNYENPRNVKHFGKTSYSQFFSIFDSLIKYRRLKITADI